MSSRLKKHKIRETDFRKEVISIMERYSNAIPLTVIENEISNYNRITLYRTMKTFVEKGIVHEISVSGMESRYALCHSECSSQEHSHKHVHFVCSNCKEVFCLEIENYPEISIPKFKIQQLEFQAFGICENC